MERYNYRYNHLRNGATIRPYVQATTTNMIKDDFTKSLHELRAFEPTPTNDNHERLRDFSKLLPIKPLSTFNLTSIKHRNESREHLTRLDNTDDRPVLRRKRFTRRQRKSVTIEPETGLILAAGPPSSSDEDESSRIICKKSPLRQQPKSISASTFELHLNQASQIKSSHISNTSFSGKSTPRGPSARRAGRRLGKLQYKNAASTNNLDEITEVQFSLKPEKRSMSVRDLNGEECDFSNRDSVVKWTSQILAELNSLPSSCIDLTQESLVNNDQKDRKWSTLQSPTDPPPIPPHLSLNARMTQSTFIPFDDSCTWREADMTSSVHSDWKPSYNGSRRLSSISNVVTPILESPKLGWNSKAFVNSTPEIMSMEPRFPSSLQDLRTMIQDDSDDSRRDREDSLNTSTLVGSSSDSDTGTPLALSPVPMEIVDFPMLSEKLSTSTGNSSLERRSIGVQGPETPLFYSRVCTDIDSPMSKSVFAPLQIVLSDEATNEKHILSTGSLPLPNKQPVAPQEHAEAEEQSRTSENTVEDIAVTKDEPAIRMRQTTPSSNRYKTESVLLKNIERLSKTAVEKNNQRYSQISNILNMEDNFGSEETLNKWKKRVECRSRLDISNATANEVPSVDRVIASLIRTVEETRFTAPDRPQSLGIDQLKPQDATTQTSPYSISRSSSFDWINDMSEGRLRDLNTPVCTPKTDASVSANYISKPVESSSETDDADREVAEVTRNAILCDHIIPSFVPQKRSASAERAIKNKKLFDEMEESIAMLLQYGEENKPKPIPRKNISKDVEPRRRATQEIRRPFPQFPMSESIYDNMCNKSRLTEKESPIVSKRENVINSSVPIAKASMEDLGDSKDDGNLSIPISAQRAGSCELLNKIPESPSAGLRDKLKIAEKEAIEVCQWLIQAGFPQYANQYKEGLVPIDLSSVKKDHEFLEPDSLKALFRRLDTLNRCAIMRIDNVVLRRRNDNYAYDMYSCDEDDNVALSGNWQYQRNSHTWSRVANEPMYGAVGRVVSTSQSTVPHSYRDPYVVKSNRHSPYDERSDHHQVRLDRYDQQHQNEQHLASDLPASKLSRSQSERIKDTARAFMKRMNPRSGSRRRRESRTRDASQLKISEPVLLSYDSASPECMQMMNRLHRPNMIQERGRSLADRPSRSKSTNRRQGVLLLTPTSPESSPNDDLIRGMRHRDRSMPPRAFYDSQSSYANHSGYGYDRSRRDRSNVEDYLYQDSPITSSRSRATYLRQPYLDTSFSPLYGSGASSPIYSSPYSSRSFATPPSRPRQQLNVQADGYFVHGSSFEISPDTTSTRKTRPFTSSPSTSVAVLAPQLRVDTLRNKSQSSLENTDEEQCGVAPSNQNRRDSGVGSSLSRSPSGPSSQRIRQSVLPYYQTLTSSLTSSSNSSSMGSWNGTATKRRIATCDRVMTSSLTSCSGEDIFFSDEQLLSTIDGLSCFELTKMRKLAFLRMTAILEKYMGVTNAIKFEPYNSSSGSSNVGSGAHKNNWTVQKLIKKIKQMDTKTGKETEESTVFGQSLEVIYRRSGRCLPRTIIEILRYLRQMAPDTVGMFRKNGVKSRINELRAVCDRDADTDVFVESQRLDAGQVHDVADLLKQYLRELPNPLMTSRLSEVFAGIFLHVPDNESIRLSALQFAILLLPDENREALQTLLLFLADVAKYSAVNSMPAQNLSVCFTPSIFHLSASRLDKISANRRHKTIGSAYGMPTEREMKETRAAQMCLTFMIQHVRSIFLVPETVSVDRKECEDAPLLKDLGTHGPRAYLMERVTDLIQENTERWKGWIVEGHLDGVEISSRKPTDDQPLRPIRVWVDVPAPPKEVMHRILRERSVWDVDVINWRVIDTVYPPDTDVHQYVLNDTIGHPTRDCYVVRHHRVDMPELPGACAIAERSIQCGETQLLGGVSATVFDVRFLIEPKSGYSRVTYLARVDLKGRSSTWYNKVYGNVLARQMARLRESFRKTDEYGPETKV